LTDNAQNRWRNSNGEPLICAEKIAVLEENMAELQAICHDMLDDAMLMGCSEHSAKKAMREIIEALTPGVKERL
jgi:hypothetical protein